MTDKKLTKDSTLADIFKNNKKANDILGQNGVPCVTCPMAKMEMDQLKIGEVAKIYGLDLDKILKDLNK